jgi:hypothetical protein
MAYEIGYRRPPPSGQFKKGASGNPKGRPKGSKNFMTLLEQELAQKIVVNEGGRRKSVTRLQAMVKRLVAGAMQGDVKQLLILVEILRKAGGLETPGTEDLLPENYETVLEAYIAGRKTDSGTGSPNSHGGER